jgi:hypothetical protein
LAKQLFLLSAKQQIVPSRKRKKLLAKLSSFEFADFLQNFDAQGFFPAECKTAKSQFPESAKSSLPNYRLFDFFPLLQIFIASKRKPRNDDDILAHRLPAKSFATVCGSTFEGPFEKIAVVTGIVKINT